MIVDMIPPKHWQDVVVAVLGAVLLVSPWIGGYGGNLVAIANALLTGSFVALVALGATVLTRPWEPWALAALGCWLAAAPWILGFSGDTPATATALLLSVPVVALAVWRLAGDARATWAHRPSRPSARR